MGMGFGSYDESEQENQEIETDFENSEAVEAEEAKHRGEVEFEFTSSNDELLDQLEDIKDE